jgi:nicotinate-nucleotide adenylyltransferase
MKRIALLGGSFDPVHNGHLHIAREILKSGTADGIVFLPNARHNFKRDKVLLSFELRFELVQLALEPGMQVWDDDSRGSGYTSDLLKTIYAKYPELTFSFVIGSDNLANLPKWHDYSWLCENARFLVLPRPGYPLESAALIRIPYTVLEIEPSAVSSTLVRERIAAGGSLSGLVPGHLEGRIWQLYSPLLQSKPSG